MIGGDDVDVVVEATGHPAAGIAHARRCASQHGKHIVMVNVEADVLAGPLLAAEARQAGVVYSHGLRRSAGAHLRDGRLGPVLRLSRGGRRQGHQVPADLPRVDAGHGLAALRPQRRAGRGGRHEQPDVQFVSGRHQIRDRDGGHRQCYGLEGADPTASPFRPAAPTIWRMCCARSATAGNWNSPARWKWSRAWSATAARSPATCAGACTCVFEAPNDYGAACFKQYGMNTDDSGRYSAMYKPFHLIGLELNISILSAALRRQPTGAPVCFNGDVAAMAKRDLNEGETLDGEGGYTV